MQQSTKNEQESRRIQDRAALDAAAEKLKKQAAFAGYPMPTFYWAYRIARSIGFNCRAKMLDKAKR